MGKQKIFRCSEDAVASCALVVNNGGVIVYPTDTIYGIGCDPYNDLAVKRIFAIKGRNEKKPLPVLTYSIQDAERIVSLGWTGRMLAKRYWPGALTIVAPIIDRRMSPQTLAGGSSLAVRIPANNCVLMLLRHCKYLIGTSANLSGHRPPKSAQEVLNSGLQAYDALLDGGTVEKGVESTIVSVEDKPKILREGAIKSREILHLIGQI
ncbi:MAG: L-threonylcarbamoyladenylate synthase [Thermoproteota archaeon]|jgi:L-threonylcarbamoyladenylate synthase|nr:L-threonylcarbamoyladenylate synthase [Thermoproteota archaeon]MDQ5841976.1 L-threonylcarbamoyladenylate synthase [Thermoproteota archaeon]